MKYKKRKAQMILAVTLLVFIILNLCPETAWTEIRKEKNPVIRKTITTAYDFSTENAVEHMQQWTHTYDKEGRKISIEGLEKNKGNGFNEISSITYEVDRNKNPISIIIDSSGDEMTRIEVQIENHYNGRKITEAIVTDILVDGESHKEELAEAKDTKTSFYDETYRLFKIPINCLIEYRGYKDMYFRSGTDEVHYENNRDKITLKSYYSGYMDETITEFKDDGSIKSTSIHKEVWDGEETETSNTLVIDGQHYITGIGAAGKDEYGEWSEMMAWFQYSEERESPTGEIYRDGTIKEIEGKDVQSDGLDGLQCFLDKKGTVIRTELKFKSNWTFTYYENNRKKAEEIYYSGKRINRTEYIYFS